MARGRQAHGSGGAGGLLTVAWPVSVATVLTWTNSCRPVILPDCPSSGVVCCAAAAVFHAAMWALRVGVCHEPKMPLLTELENLFLFWFYKDFTPAALSGTSPIPENIAGRNVRDGHGMDAGKPSTVGATSL